MFRILTSQLMRRPAAGCLLLAIVALLPACGQNKPLRVAVSPWVGFESLSLAEEFGWLPKQVRLERVSSMADSVAGLRNGSVDAAGLTLDEMLLARARGLPLTAVSVFDVSAGADQLLARPQLRTLGQLRGRRVGLTESALSPLLLARALETVGMGLDDVVAVRLTDSTPIAAWSRNEVDAIVTYEPYATRLRRSGAVALFDSRDMPDSIIDVLVIHRDRVKPRALRALLAAQFRAVSHIRTHHQDARYRIAARYALDPADVSLILGSLVLPDARASRSYLQPGGELEKAARRLSDFMVEQRLLSTVDSLEQLQDPRALPGDG